MTSLFAGRTAIGNATLALALALGTTLSGDVAARQTPTAPATAASDQRPAEGFVLGQVVDAATRQPVPHATVRFTPRAYAVGDALAARFSAGLPTEVLADATGRFVLRGLPRGSYLFNASAPGYLDGGYGVRRPDDRLQPFDVDEGQRVDGVSIALTKAALLSGIVSDETGAPIVDVWVSLLRQTSAVLSQRRGARTDDRGAYAIGGIAPGTYLVTVPNRMTAMPTSVMASGVAFGSLESSGVRPLTTTRNGLSPAVRLGDFLVSTSDVSATLASRLPFSRLPDGRVSGYVTTFHPDATTISGATRLTIQSGDEQTGVDIRLRPTTLVPVAGVVTEPSGQPLPHIGVHLIPSYAAGQRSFEHALESAVTATDGSGSFAFPAVLPGSYVVKVWRHQSEGVIGPNPLSPDSSLWGEVALSIGDAALRNVAIHLRQGVTVSGRVEFDGSRPRPLPRALQSVISQAFEPHAWSMATMGSRFGARVTEEGRFSTQGLPPGQHAVRVTNSNLATGLAGWFVDGVTLNGNDLTVTPLVLAGQPIDGVVMTLTDRRTDLIGEIRDGQGRLNPNGAVVAFPADYTTWIRNGMSGGAARVASISSGGTYEIAAIKSGEYLVATTSSDALTAWPEASMVEALAPFATRVTIARGEVRRLNLRTP